MAAYQRVPRDHSDCVDSVCKLCVVCVCVSYTASRRHSNGSNSLAPHIITVNNSASRSGPVNGEGHVIHLHDNRCVSQALISLISTTAF